MQIITEAAYTLSSGGSGVRQHLTLGTLVSSLTSEDEGLIIITNTSTTADGFVVRLVRRDTGTPVSAGAYIPAQQAVALDPIALKDGLFELLGDDGATAEVVIFADTGLL